MSRSQRPYAAILRNDHLGDLILTTGLVRNLAQAGWKVDVLCKAPWRPVFDQSPHATAYGFGEEGVPPATEPRALAAWLRPRGYSHLLVPYRESNLLKASFFSGVPSRWAQFGRFIARLYLHRTLPSGIYQKPRHMADVWLDFARAQGISVDDGHPELFLCQAEKDLMREKISFRLGTSDYFVVHPFHGRSSCNWPLEKYEALIDLLAGQSGQVVVVTGSAQERPLLEPFMKKWNNLPVWVSCGEVSLREFFAIIGGAKTLVCSSTGALHISSALNVPSVSLFCPHPTVSPVLWGSFSDHHQTVSPSKAACPRFANPDIKACLDCGFSSYPTAGDIHAMLTARS